MGRLAPRSLRFWLVLGLALTATHAPMMSTHLGRPTWGGAAWGHCLGAVKGFPFTPTLRGSPTLHLCTAAFSPCTPAYSRTGRPQGRGTGAHRTAPQQPLQWALVCHSIRTWQGWDGQRCLSRSLCCRW